MTEYEHIDPESGFIDCVVHSLTGGQVLFYLLRTWEKNPNQPVTVWTRDGEAVNKVKAMRVVLSKRRKANKQPRLFEIHCSEAWRHTHNGIRGEAVLVTRETATVSTQVKVAFMKLGLLEN